MDPFLPELNPGPPPADGATVRPHTSRCGDPASHAGVSGVQGRGADGDRAGASGDAGIVGCSGSSRWRTGKAAPGRDGNGHQRSCCSSSRRASSRTGSRTCSSPQPAPATGPSCRPSAWPGRSCRGEGEGFEPPASSVRVGPAHRCRSCVSQVDETVRGEVRRCEAEPLSPSGNRRDEALGRGLTSLDASARRLAVGWPARGSRAAAAAL